jgi:hypothetical protein
MILCPIYPFDIPLPMCIGPCIRTSCLCVRGINKCLVLRGCLNFPIPHLTYSYLYIIIIVLLLYGGFRGLPVTCDFCSGFSLRMVRVSAIPNAEMTYSDFS